MASLIPRHSMKAGFPTHNFELSRTNQYEIITRTWLLMPIKSGFKSSLLHSLTSFVILDKLFSMCLRFLIFKLDNNACITRLLWGKQSATPQENVSLDGDVWVRSFQKPKLQAPCSLVLEKKHGLNSHYKQLLGTEHTKVIITQSCHKELHV